MSERNERNIITERENKNNDLYPVGNSLFAIIAVHSLLIRIRSLNFAVRDF